MMLGLSSYAYRWSIAVKGYIPAHPLDTRRFILKAIEHGVQGVHLCDHLDFIDQPEEELKEIRSLIEENGIFVETGASNCNSTYLEKMIRISCMLGSHILRAVPEVNCDYSSDEISYQVEEIKKNLGQVLNVATRCGVKIALENHGRITASEMLSVVTGLDSEWVGVCLDTMNSVVLLEKPEYTAELLGPLTITAHFKDFKIIPDPRGHRIIGACLGEGMVDFTVILEILRRSGVDPNINIELFIDRRENEEVTHAWENYCVKKSIHYARDVLRI
ncbi:MAG: hypothetical protein DRP87_19015 [Spirochaetes bacterium]|nr:MAG: hypothetical protein DRP87_19015 [Spirochaetota bacterium]